MSRNIDEIRSELDASQLEILKAVAKRMKLIPEIAKYKLDNNLPRKQPKREEEVIANARKIAAKEGMNPEVAEEIMKILIKHAHEIEKEYLE
ncbi:MAG: chorismate mutase [bacterium]|nr:chorismate mutase [bacterium]